MALNQPPESLERTVENTACMIDRIGGTTLEAIATSIRQYHREIWSYHRSCTGSQLPGERLDIEESDRLRRWKKQTHSLGELIKL